MSDATDTSGGGERGSELLRRGVIALGAALLLVLPRFTSSATFLGALDGPGPVETVVSGLAFWLMPVLLAASWVAAGRIRIPHPWLTLPVGLFLVGCIISTAVASNQSSALVRAAQLSGLWAAAWALVQAIRTDAERRLLLATLVATACFSAAVAVHQARFGLPETWDYFQAHREEVLARHGIQPGSWQEKLFVDRFEGGVQAAMGHPNVLAALLVMALLVAAGFVREKWAEAAGWAKLFAVGVLGIGAAMAWALWLTQSRGGLGALLVGGYLLAVGWCVRRRRLRIVLWLLPLVVGAVALAAATQVDHPAVEGALLTLRYRLDYWRGTWPILAGHGLAGVGLENFGHHYLEHKLATAPEEVADPHNLWLSVWSQLGLAGLAATVGLVAFAAGPWSTSKKTLSVFSAERASSRGRPDAGHPESLGYWLIAVLVPAGSALAYLYIRQYALIEPPVAAMFFGSAVLVFGAAAAEDPKRLALAGRPLRSLRGAAVAAVVAFLVQGLIGTAFLVPATAWALMVVVAASLRPGRGRPRVAEAGPDSDDDGAAGSVETGRAIGLPVRFALMLLAMAAVFAYAHLLLVPVGQARALLAEARRRAGPGESDELLRRAGQVLPLAWEPPLERGRMWHAAALEAAARGAPAPQVGMAFEPAVEAYREVLGRHPRFRPALVLLAQCRLAMPGAQDDPGALGAARAHLERALALYPTHLPTALELADVLDRLEAGAAALAAYERVLELDALMPEPSRKLSDEQRKAVRERVAALKQKMGRKK